MKDERFFFSWFYSETYHENAIEIEELLLFMNWQNVMKFFRHVYDINFYVYDFWNISLVFQWDFMFIKFRLEVCWWNFLCERKISLLCNLLKKIKQHSWVNLLTRIIKYFMMPWFIAHHWSKYKSHVRPCVTYNSLFIWSLRAIW